MEKWDNRLPWATQDDDELPVKKKIPVVYSSKMHSPKKIAKVIRNKDGRLPLPLGANEPEILTEQQQ